MFAAGVVGVAHLFLVLFASNSGRFPAARRVFIGWRLAVHSLVVLTAFTMLTVQLFEPDVNVKSLRPTVSMLLVWVPSWVCHLILLRYARGTSPQPQAAMALPVD
jgi:hypothetical protein